MCVQDVDRPDVNGVPPKMQEIAVKASVALVGLVPHLQIVASDNFHSNVMVRGSFDPKDTWVNGIWQNSRHFRFNISPTARYYKPGDLVCVELEESYNVPKFRKYTNTPEKCIVKLKEWLQKGNTCLPSNS